MIGTVAIYSSVLIASTIAAHNATKSNKQKTLHVFFVILVLSLLVGLRSDEVGIDSSGYARIYSLYGDVNSIEIGFQWLIKFLHIFSDSYTFFFLTVAFATNSLIISRLWELRGVANFGFSVFAYTGLWVFYTMSGIRQWLVVAIIFWATRYLDKGKVVKFILIVLAAMLIHTSSFVALLILLPSLFKQKGRKWTILRGITIFSLPIALWLAYRLFDENYSSFLTTAKVDIGFMIPLRLVLLAMFLLVLKQSKPKDGAAKKDIRAITIGSIIFFQFVSIGLSALGYFFNNVARVGWYFEIFTPLYYSYIFGMKPSRTFDMKVLLKILTVVLILYLFISSSLSTANRLMPYSFFWQK